MPERLSQRSVWTSSGSPRTGSSGVGMVSLHGCAPRPAPRASTNAFICTSRDIAGHVVFGRQARYGITRAARAMPCRRAMALTLLWRSASTARRRQGGRYRMAEIGYALSSEEHAPNDLVRYAQRAEEIGFTFPLISDHFHPWISRQGQSPFVWSVIGGIAQATERLRLGTGVTCPTIRYHPAIIAQAAATAAAMMPGRFFLGVGTGENLNEHITGARWPEFSVRLEMLEEAVEVMRTLWQGGFQSHHGRYYSVENARIYTLPQPPPT